MLAFSSLIARTISHVFTPVAAQVQPKHDPDLLRPRRAATSMRHGNLYIARVEYLDSGAVHLRGADLIHRKGDAAKMDPDPHMLKRSQFKWGARSACCSSPTIRTLP